MTVPTAPAGTGEARVVPPGTPAAERVAVLALLAMSVVAWAAYAFAVSHRTFDALELGGGEGLQTEHVLRVAGGLHVYVEPSLRFIPMAYMPFYYVVVAPLVKLFGPHLWEGRVVSVASSLGVALLLATIVFRETKSRVYALAASGLYLMGHGLAKGYDSVRPDSCMMFLTLSGLFVLRMGAGARSAVIAAVLMALGFFTKQNAVCFGIAALVYALVAERERRVAFVTTYLACTLGGFFALSRWLGPWFSFYVFDVPLHWLHFSRSRMLELVGHKLFVLGALTFMSLLACALPGRPWRGRQGLWFWMGLGGIGTAVLSTFDPYAYDNVIMPTIVSLALLGTLSAARLAEQLPAPAHGGDLRRAIACAALTLQFVPLLYPLHAQYHHADSRAVREQFLQVVRSYPRVMFPYHGYMAQQAGMEGSLCVLPLDDILRGRNRIMVRDPQYFDRLFEGLRHGSGRPVLITDLPLDSLGDVSRPYWASLLPHYRLERTLGALSARLRTVLPGAVPMRYVYAPIETTPPGASGR